MDDSQHQDPKAYAKSRSLVAREVVDFLPGIIDMVGLGRRQGATWLDFGCGDGATLKEYFLPQVAKTNSKFWALDISQEMIRHAQEYCSDPKTKDFVNFVCGDILAHVSPLGHTKFDGIFAIYVLDLMDAAKVLTKLNSHLAPGGYLAIMVPETIPVHHTLLQLKTDPVWAPYATDVHFPAFGSSDNTTGLSVYLPVLESLGLEVVKAEVHPRTFYYEKLETFVGLCVSINPFASTLPPEKKTQLVKWYGNALAKLPQPDHVVKERKKFSSDDVMNIPFQIEFDSIIIVAKKK